MGVLNLLSWAVSTWQSGHFLEERTLRQELGEAYDHYRVNVPMWIPRLTPWKFE